MSSVSFFKFMSILLLFFWGLQAEEVYQEGTCPFREDLLSLARGPTPYVKWYRGYITNGFKFHTLDRENGPKTQNSGALVVGNSGDGEAATNYYRVLT